MKQILQNARSGALELAEVPAPALAAGQVLVRNAFSVVSPGTEKLALDFAKKSLLGKARSRPDLVRQVTKKLRQEGPLPTWRTVRNRLDAPQPLGYSCAGVVEAVGAGVVGFEPGQRVACAGAGYANHAELIAVPANLVVPVPDGVALEHAAFATLGAIALQGVRVAAPTLGEVAVVVGLGLIGQLGVQLLRAAGCRVLGLDLDAARTKEAAEQGAEWVALAGDDLEGWRNQATGGHGVDLALVTASSDSAAPLRTAAELCRLKGRVSIVGAVPVEIDRRIVYDRELELRMSTSYGPGRYDRTYEEEGLDYPLPYVRWTENRNLQAFLGLVGSGALRPDLLPSEVVGFEDAVDVYRELGEGRRRSLAVVFRYGETPSRERTLVMPAATGKPREGAGVAFLGAGNYAKAVLLPSVQGVSKVRPVSLVTATGASAKRTAERFGFAHCGTDPEAVFADPAVDLVFVATLHDSHADLAQRALRAGKAVWCEKPLAITPEDLEAVASAAAETGGLLAVGYNRRFSSHARAVRDAFAGRREPLAIHYRVSAGPPPGDSWITDPRVGGGRIVGEACHFVDLCTYLVGAPPRTVFARALSSDPAVDDSTVAVLSYPDGSTATIHYLARADENLPKERFEVFGEGRSAFCDNYRVTRISGGRRDSRHKTMNQDKGQATAVREVVDAVLSGGPSPFGLAELLAVTRATFAIEESIRSGLPVDLAGGA